MALARFVKLLGWIVLGLGVLLGLDEIRAIARGRPKLVEETWPPGAPHLQ